MSNPIPTNISPPNSEILLRTHPLPRGATDLVQVWSDFFQCAFCASLWPNPDPGVIDLRLASEGWLNVLTFPLSEAEVFQLKLMSYEPQEQDLFLKCLLEANVDGIIAFDREFRYTTWNRAMERISGVKREDVLGKCAFDLFPCLQANRRRQILLRSARRQKRGRRKPSLHHRPIRLQRFL